MAKFVFVYNDIRKIVEVPKSLYNLSKANNLLIFYVHICVPCARERKNKFGW